MDIEINTFYDILWDALDSELSSYIPRFKSDYLQLNPNFPTSRIIISNATKEDMLRALATDLIKNSDGVHLVMRQIIDRNRERIDEYYSELETRQSKARKNEERTRKACQRRKK